MNKIQKEKCERWRDYLSSRDEAVLIFIKDLESFFKFLD